MVDSPIGPLRAQYDAIAHKLDATAPGAQREAVKREIIAYFKQVDSLISELGELKEDIRKLVERFKQMSASTAEASAPAPPAPAPHHRVRGGAEEGERENAPDARRRWHGRDVLIGETA